MLQYFRIPGSGPPVGLQTFIHQIQATLKYQAGLPSVNTFFIGFKVHQGTLNDASDDRSSGDRNLNMTCTLERGSLTDVNIGDRTLNVTCTMETGMLT